jgi:hypothetical protein
MALNVLSYSLTRVLNFLRQAIAGSLAGVTRGQWTR